MQAGFIGQMLAETHREKWIKCAHVSQYMQNASNSSASFSKIALGNSLVQAGTHFPFRVMTTGMRSKD